MTSNRFILRLTGAFCLVLFSLGIATSANAALVSRLGGLAVYDTDYDITWLADANLAASDTFGVSNVFANGTMSWDTAESWIGAMNTASYLGYSDWRLPTTLQPDSSCDNQTGDVTGTISHGLNCSGSEMGHLFYNELGGTAGTSILASHNSYFDLFSNIQADVYWSGTEYAPNPTGQAWVFGFLYGGQDADLKTSTLYGWAVRPGDITVVPLPAAFWLFGSGLLGLFGLSRRSKID